MIEYIKREQVKDELLSWAVCINHPEHLLKEDALGVIDAIPAADVVEVVRCKFCRWQKTCTTARRLGWYGYCSDGERRVEDNE